MDILSSTSASDMEIDATIASKSRIPHWLEVQCETGSSPSCDAKRVDAVTVTGSHDVFIRYEAPDNGSNGAARARVIKGDVHDPNDVLVQLRWTGELLTLDIRATRKTVEVVLLQKDQLQRVVVQGSGDVVVEDNVLATMGPSLSIAALGSGDVYATSTETIRVDTLTLTSKGSGLLQTSLSEIRVSKLLLQHYSSGDVALFSTAVGGVDKLSVIAQGSGDACLSWNSPVSVNQLEVEQGGSCDVSIGPQGSCQAAKLAMHGSRQLDVGGVLCDSVEVDLMSSGDVVVQVIDSLSVEAYGSGNVSFSGKPPSSITNTGYGRLYPTPVSSSYFPATCKRHKVPVIKTKYAALSSGVPGVEFDSAESSSSSVADTNAVGIFWDGMNRDKDNLIPLVAFVFLVAMVLRWFNNSCRRAREEQRQPLLEAQRRVYV